MPHASVADVFPEQPENYTWLSSEPKFDANKHLQLEQPKQSWSLAELGYEQSFIEKHASDIAMYSTARLLSDEGVSALQEVATSLQTRVRHGRRHRAPACLRGTVFMSKFIRDLTRSDDIAQFASDLFATPLVPHTMVYQQGHMNFAPEDIGTPVDYWHHDFVGFDYVLMAHDPATHEGGDFQYFLGTREEGRAIVASGNDIPVDRIVTPHFPGAGYACFMQGGAVYHRATALTAPADRVSLVNAYVSLDVSKPDPTRTFFVSAEGPYSWIEEDAERRHTFADYARHTAWLSREKLTRVLQDLPFDASREDSMSSLRAAAADLQRAIETLEIGPQRFEDMEALRRRYDRELLG